MQVFKALLLTAIFLVFSLTLAACTGSSGGEPADGAGGIVVENVQANMTLPSDTGSFWMEITNNSGVDDALIGGAASGCATIELHNMFMENDVMIMREVEGGEIPIPAGETVILEQGGLHAMCIGKAAPLEAGSEIEFDLLFAEAGKIAVQGVVVEPGQMPMDMEDR